MFHKNIGKSPLKPKDPYFNYFLRNKRIEKSYSIYDLERLTGISSSTIQAYERMRIKPNNKNKKLLANSLESSIEDLFPDKIKDYYKQIYKERKNKKKENKKIFLFFQKPYYSIDYYKKISNDEIKIIISRAIDRLPEKQKKNIIDYYLTEKSLSLRKIGKSKDVTGYAISLTISRGLNNLRKDKDILKLQNYLLEK